jgi:hypothetical protein
VAGSGGSGRAESLASTRQASAPPPPPVAWRRQFAVRAESFKLQLARADGRIVAAMEAVERMLPPPTAPAQPTTPSMARQRGHTQDTTDAASSATHAREAGVSRAHGASSCQQQQQQRVRTQSPAGGSRLHIHIHAPGTSPPASHHTSAPASPSAELVLSELGGSGGVSQPGGVTPGTREAMRVQGTGNDVGGRPRHVQLGGHSSNEDGGLVAGTGQVAAGLQGEQAVQMELVGMAHAGSGAEQVGRGHGAPIATAASVVMVQRQRVGALQQLKALRRSGLLAASSKPS